MASKDQIKKVILDVAGNPGVGAVADLADKWAEAIAALDEKTPRDGNAKAGKSKEAVEDGTQNERPEKEIRVIKPTDIR